MTLRRVPLLCIGVVALLAAACTSTDHDGAAPPPSTATAPGATAAATTPAATPATIPPVATPPARTGQPPVAGDWHVTYGWAVPSTPARVEHRVRVPVDPPPGEPLPTLVQVQVGDHPAEGFSRISFAFRGPLPSYQLAYVDRLQAEGQDAVVELPGAADLAVRFSPAQAHDEHGRATASVPPATIGYPTLRGWAAAGDFEGQVSFGLGVARTVPVRCGESTRPDGTHVISVDVRRG
ncbi:AMIN-like domain-containing (lipo)protein [Micromonospora auratinigra]|uniref:AMIN-like domain-containing protein n=1 Tax=Micromonospora auratinigra TaxID=261654 RepID=A0A1A8ZJ63_9ACTN|nr:hypothetical protein [Micromonospora auratinigra]SBT43883.1 hypothetical protein GA0070611_2492 [Micromonospora auratinigra]